MNSHSSLLNLRRASFCLHGKTIEHRCPSSPGFTLTEALVSVSIISLVAALILPVVTSIREKSRVLHCISNLGQIASGMNFYKTNHARFPSEPLEDFRPLEKLVTELRVFRCPSTTHELKAADDLNGNTSYRYFGTRKDLKRKGLTSEVTGSGLFDPADPGRGWPQANKFGAVYDRDYTNHDDNCLNIVYFDDSHWERLCSMAVSPDAETAGEEGDAPGSGTGQSNLGGAGSSGGASGSASSGGASSGSGGSSGGGSGGSSSGGSAGSSSSGSSGSSGGGGDQTTLCHIPPGNPEQAHTITVGAAAVAAHLAHGDTLGPCPGDDMRGRRVTICHIPPGEPQNAHTITVGEAAVAAHLAHGDTLGACGQPSGGSGASGGGSGGSETGSGGKGGN